MVVPVAYLSSKYGNVGGPWLIGQPQPGSRYVCRMRRKIKLEVDADRRMRQPGRMHGRTYARTDGQAENIMPTGRAEA